jgi:hypothetical protein
MTDEAPSKNVTNMHRSVSIALLQSSNCFAVRTPRGQKDPGPINWDPRSNSANKSRENIETLKRTNDNLGIHLFGTTVDVDVDSDNPYLLSALDWFLPHTPHIWGRPSRRRTHRLYELSGLEINFDPADYPFLTRLQSHDAIKLEIRGGDQKSGRYSLLPGSVHPSGEEYEWEDVSAAKSTPVLTSVWKVIDGVRFACVAGLLAPYWTEGQRNQMCMALSGFMHRASSYSQEMAMDMPFDREAARRLLEGLMEVAGDDPADFPMRFKTFDQTWDKADEGVPVVGASRLTELTGDKEVLPLLYSLLAHTPEMQELDAIFEQFAVLRNTTSVVDLKVGAGGTYVMNKDAFVFTMAGRWITTPRGRTALSGLFLNSLQRTIVDKITIHPSKPLVFDVGEEKVANIWKGWGIDPYEGDVSDDDVQPFLEYLREVVSSGDPRLMAWVLMWIADIFQNPASKPGTAIVLVGAQGAGKSVLAENVLRPIIGDAHFTKVGSIEKLAAKFNSHMSGRLLIQGEEVISSKRKQDANTLKDAITSYRRSIEMKGRDVFEIDDFARYLFTSNHRDDAVSVETGDRRYTIIEVAKKYAFMGGAKRKERDEYWSQFFGWLQNKDGTPHTENLAKLHKWLLGVKIDQPFIRSAMETEIKRQTQQNSSRGMDSWLLSIIEMANPLDTLKDDERGYEYSYALKGGKIVATREWPEFISYTLLELAMKRHTARDYGEARTAQQIATFFKTEGLLENTDRRGMRVDGRVVRLRPFPSRKSIENYLKLRGYSLIADTEDTETEVEDEEF